MDIDLPFLQIGYIHYQIISNTSFVLGISLDLPSKALDIIETIPFRKTENQESSEDKQRTPKETKNTKPRDSAIG